MRSYRSIHNLLAVSAASKETGINTEQTLDVSMLVDMGDVINLEPRRETNAEEQIGKEEPDAIYDLGALSMGPVNFNKAQPQHFAFLMAYALGNITTSAAGSGYEHAITPIDGDEDGDRSLPSFTAAQRFGKTVMKRRFASMFVDSFNAVFSKDDWCKINGDLKGTGKKTDSIVEETVNAAKNATSLTLAANGVQGSTAQERLDNVQRIKVELTTGVWTEVDYSVVSSATPAAITITAPGGTTDLVDYKILYNPTESGWMSFPSRITETPLRVSQMKANLGGTWNGTTFEGGRELTAEIRSIEWNYANNLEIEFVPGAGGAYASRAFRPQRSQTLKLDREFRDYIMQQHINVNDSFGFYILAEGAVFDTPHKYQVEIIFPKAGVISAPLSVDGKRNTEAGDITIMEHDTYGSVIARVKNLQSAYAS